MDQMKEREGLKHHFPWEEPWVLDTVLVHLVSHLHQQVERMEMTSSSLVSATSSTNSEASRNNNTYFVSFILFQSDFPFIFIVLMSILSRLECFFLVHTMHNGDLRMFCLWMSLFAGLIYH